MKNHTDIDRKRFSLPEVEARHPWFIDLLRAYAFLDMATASDITRTKRQPACHAGCDACCHQPIPVTPSEVMGIRLFLQFSTAEDTANRQPLNPASHTLKAASAQNAGPTEISKNSRPLQACPFLEKGICRVYVVRPFVCRRYVVFSTPCRMGEQATETRPGDVLSPSRHAQLYALRMTMSFYAAVEGIITKSARPDEEETPLVFFLKKTLLLHEITW